MNTAHLQVVSLHPAGWLHISKLIKDQIITSKITGYFLGGKVRCYKLDWKTEVKEGSRPFKKTKQEK